MTPGNPARPEPTRTARLLGRAALVVAAATMASKILGLLRESVLAARFGATNLTDAYNFAALLPLVLFAAVGVAITNVFIPLFSGVLSQSDQREAERFAANVNGAVTVAGLILVGILEVTAGPVVRVLLPSRPAEFQHLCAQLVRISAPIILFYAWSAIVGGVLNVRGFFGPNAAMGIPQNLTIISAILVGSLAGRQDITLVAWGSLAGTFTTYLIQLPALRHSRFRVGWRLDLRDPMLHRMARLVGPAALTAFAQQIGSLVVSVLAARIAQGSITDFTYASRLQLLTYSILGMSIATVVYPRLASVAAGRDMRDFRRTFARGLGMVSAVTVPLAIGLCLLRVAAIGAVYQHGSFTAADTAATAGPLAFLSLGTVAYAWQDYTNRAFYALQDTRTPMRAALIGTAVGIALALVLYRAAGLAGLGLAMGLGWSSAAAFLVWRLRHRLGLLGGRRIGASSVRLVVAAVAGFVPAAWAVSPLGAALGGGVVTRALAFVACGLGGVAIYAACGLLLRVPEIGEGMELARGVWHRLRHAA